MVQLKPAPFFRSRTSVITIIVFALTLCSCMMKKPTAPTSFPMDMASLSALIEETGDPVVRSGLYEARARLQLKADNSQPDFHGALVDFKDCLKSDPERENNEDIQDWIAILSRLEITEKNASRYEYQNKKAKQQNLSLKERIAELEKQEEALRKSIEELQALEFQMEERRRQIR